MEPLLTITASNKNRLDLNSPATQWFIKSIQWQDYDNFELLIVDSDSKNYEELKTYFSSNKFKIPIRIIQHKIDLFSRSELNNVGIRNARGQWIGCTDVDMVYAKNFVSTVVRASEKNCLIVSRTMYWKKALQDKIYSGALDFLNNIDSCKVGKIKKRSSAGGFEYMHIESWSKVRGFDEKYRVWGSEDRDLLTRTEMAGIKTKWLGENIETIMLFHQEHIKKDIKNDLEWQEKNKKLLNNIKDYRANLSGGWGGIKD